MNGRRWVLVIADDLTGALEVGAKFAGQGIEARVTTEIALCGPPETPVLVIDTETRHLPADEAGAVVRRALENALRFAPWLVYTKTDSTLRGNIAAEFRAFVDAMPGRTIVYAPCYAEMGRTVKHGRLFVDGVPVDQSAFGSDPLDPVRESDIGALVGDVPALVLDGESSADVLAAAHRILAADPPAIAAGPAALAGALAECLPDLGGAAPRVLPCIARCLVINGSLHPASLEQIAFARTNGCFEGEWRYFENEFAGGGIERAKQAGDCVRRAIDAAPVDALAVFGGDTAFGIHETLGGQPFEAWGEVLPGVPLSRSGNLFWITKAGGFGGPGVVCEIRRRLT